MTERGSERVRIQIDRVYLIKTPASSRWYIEWCAGGRQLRKSTGTTSKKQAMLIASKQNAKLLLGQLEAPTKLRNEKLADAITIRVTFLEDQRKSPQTISNYRRSYLELLCWLRIDLGREPRLSDLEPTVLQRFDQVLKTTGVIISDGKRKRRQGGANGPGTRHKKLEAIRGLIMWSLSYKLVAEDPSKEYRVPPKFVPKIENFTKDEVRRILTDADQNHSDVWITFLRTGMRSGELRWLQKSDVDLTNMQINIRPKSCPYTGMSWTPKHNHRRAIPIADAELEQALRRQIARSESVWVFSTNESSKTDQGRLRAARLIRRFQRHLKCVGITHGTLHVLRHCCLSHLANLPGVPITHVQRFAGHKDLRVTQGYLHTEMSDIQGTMAKVDFNEMAAERPQNQIRQELGKGVRDGHGSRS